MELKAHRILDFTILLISLILVYVSVYKVNIPTVNRGFICRDPSISYPFKRNSIKTRWILLHLQLIFILVIFVTEFFVGEKQHRILKRLRKTFCHASLIIMRYLMIWSLMIIPFMFVKKMTGVLRPHFLDRCKPNVTECVTGTLVENYHCTNENLSYKKMQIIMESFPSGHAALVVYFSVVLMYYFHKRLSHLQSEFVVPLIQGTLLVFSAIVCSSRISDNAHHASDVLFGTITGLIFAFFCCRSMFKNVHKEEPQTTDLTLENLQQ